MKVLVACHCEEPVLMSYEDEIRIYSPKLTFIKNPFGKNTEINPDGIELYYVEVSDDCKSYNSKYQYKGWEDIPKNSFDIIWYQSCQIYEYKINKDGKVENDTFKDILTSSLSVLKPGGGIMMSLSKERKRLAGQFIESNFPKVNYKFVENENIPYCMVEMDGDNIPNTDKLEDIIDHLMLIITKKQNNEKLKGGKKSKSKKSTKSKKQKKSMKSNRSNIKK
jgi:hypothetical protein